MRKLYDMIEGILAENKRARNDDGYLFREVLKEVNPHVLTMSVDMYLTHRADIVPLPTYDSVTRIRRKVQEEQPWLGASDKVKEWRTDNEEIYRAIARNEVR